LTMRRFDLQFRCQGVWCDCLSDGVLTGPPQEASGTYPWWKPVAGRYLTGMQRAFFMRRGPFFLGRERVPAIHADAQYATTLEIVCVV